MFNFKIKKQWRSDFTIDVNFQVEPGEIVALMGSSGAGKTSILDAIAGLIIIDAGQIERANKDYCEIPVHLRRFGYVKQDSLLFPHLTAFENMTYNRRQTPTQLEEYIDVFQLQPHLEKYPSELSGGQAKRVAMVRTLMSDPQLLLLDEAFSSLDSALRLKIRTYLKKQLNIPIVLVTHDETEATHMGDRILYLEQGTFVSHQLTSNAAPQLSIAILAGGEGKRLGGYDKAFLSIGHETFLERLLQQMTDFDDVMLSVRDQAPYTDYPYPTLMDITPRIGPIGGIYTSLQRCKHEALFVCGVDMPYVTKKLINFMSAFISTDYDAFIIKSTSKIHPLCGIYKKSALPYIEQMIQEKNYRLTDLLRRLNTKEIPLTYSCFSDDIVMNVNTKKDLQKLKTPAIFCVSGIKNSGKTTLITKLIEAFKGEGYRMGVIKHDGHEFDIDHRGTDTYQHRQAGSVQTLIYSKHQMAFMRDQEGFTVEAALNYFNDVDYIIVEGLKDSALPKIEVVVENSVCHTKHLLAIATDGSFKHPVVPTFKRSDIQALVALIKEKVVNGHQR